MVCSTCLKQAKHIKILPDGTELCNFCGEFSEASGPNTTNILTRNAFRVRNQSIKYEGDMILPHTFNKATKRLDVNPEFVKQFPDKVKDYFSEKEIKDAGLPKLATRANKIKKIEKENKQKQKDIFYSGSTKKALQKVLTP